MSVSRFHELKPENPLSRRFAAVGGESRTGAEGCFVGCEKHDHLGNLFGPPHALEWYCRNQAGFPLVSAGKPGQHACIDRTRSDDVDADSKLGRLERCRTRKPFDRMLAGRVKRGARGAQVAMVR
jgi:hypothetical protein